MSGDDIALRATLDTSGAASGFQTLNGHLNDFGIKTNTASASLGPLGTVLGSLASPMTLVAGGAMALGAALSSSVTVAGDFQQKMAGVNAIVGGSAADMQTLSNAAREAGASTSFSATQAADALGFMAGAGWNVSHSTAALKDTLTLASAGAMDLAQAGDLMTNTVSQFGLAATDAGRVSNVLAAGASATNTSVSQLGEGMKVVGATANAFGMGLESTTAALGLLSNAGIKGSEGGTALRGILASLATQTGPAAAALGELGLSTADVNPEMVSLSTSMSLLQSKGMTATQAIAIFGRENVSAATYMAANASSLSGLQTSITGTSKASEMAAIQTATYQGAMGGLSSAVEEAQIALGTALLPAITDGVGALTTGIVVVTEFGTSFAEAAGNTTLFSTLGTTATSVGNAVGAAFDNLTAIVGPAWEAIGGGSDSVDLMTTALDVITAPLNLTISGIGLLADGFTAVAEAAAPVAEIIGTGLGAVFGAIWGEDAAQNTEISAKEMATQTAGVYGDYLAQGIAENKDLAKAPGEALTSDDAKKSAEDAGKEWIKAFGSQFEAGMTQLADGSWIGGDTSQNKSLQQIGFASINGVELRSIFNVSLKQFELKDKDGNVLASRSASDLGITDMGNPEQRAKAIERMLQASGWTYGRAESLELQGNTAGAEKVKLVGNIEIDNLWDVSNSQRSWMKYTDENKELAARAGDEIIYELYNAEQMAIKANDPTLTESLANVMKALGEPGSVPAQMFATSLEDLVAAGFISTESSGKIKAAAAGAAKSFADALGMNMKNAMDKFDWSTVLNTKLIRETGDGGLDFMKNAFQPELIENATKNLELWNTGLVANRDQVEKNIQAYIKMAEINPWLFTADQLSAIDALTQGLGDEGDMLERVIKKTESLKTETKKFAVATDDAAACCGQLLSLFGAWQEMTPELFRPDYLGPSFGKEFDDAIIAKAASLKLQELNNERYAQATRGIVSDKSELISVATELLQKAYEGKLTAEDYSLAVRFLGVEVDTTAKRFGDLATAIEGVRAAKESITSERTIEFNQETPTDITPTLGLNTDAAINEFLVFKAAIEGEKINVDLSTTNPKTANKDAAPQQQNVGQISQLVGPLNLIRTAQGLTTTAVRQVGLDIRNSSSTERATMQAGVGMILKSTASAAGSINSTIWEAANAIIDALGNIGGISGGGGGDSSEAGSGDYFDRMDGWPTLYASGGYVDRPTLGIFGEAGGEYLVPEQDMQNLISTLTRTANVSVGMQIDASGIAGQISGALQDINVPAIRVPVQIDIDSSSLREAAEDALMEAMANMKVKR